MKKIRIPKIYLETTIFNYYFETERDAHPDTVKLFKEIANGKYQAFTSAYAINEIMNAPEDKQRKMISLIEKYSIKILRVSAEADNLALLYQKQGALPQSSTVDAQHIAVAVINDLDMILSLNFKHIVRRKTEILTGRINADLGYKPVEIRSPMEVVEDDDAQ